MNKFISFTRLGRLGRLGNQLFQVAVTMATAEKHGVPYILPGWKYLRYFTINPIQVNKKDLKFDEQYRYLGQKYKPIPYHDNRLNLDGYFQSIKYFQDTDAIFNIKIKNRIVNKAHAIIKSIKRPIASMHIRRGDYLHLQECYRQLGIDYYTKAADICDCTTYLVFSDEINWCKNNFKLPEHNTCFIHESVILDMAIMSLCDANIIANSSFSWWGAYLGNAEKIIMPKKWFGPKIKAETIDSPDDWIKI